MEHQQPKAVHWLLPGLASVLETTIACERVAVDLTGWVGGPPRAGAVAEAGVRNLRRMHAGESISPRGDHQLGSEPGQLCARTARRLLIRQKLALHRRRIQHPLPSDDREH